MHCIIHNAFKDVWWTRRVSYFVCLFLIVCFWFFQAGRSDRKEFVKKRTRLNPHASTSNKEKRRTKNFMMMRQSQNVRTKGKRSFRDKQVSCTSPIKLEIFFLENVLQFNNLFFFFFRLPYGMHSWKKRSSTDETLGHFIVYLVNNVQCITL